MRCHLPWWLADILFVAIVVAMFMVAIYLAT